MKRAADNSRSQQHDYDATTAYYVPSEPAFLQQQFGWDGRVQDALQQYPESEREAPYSSRSSFARTNKMDVLIQQVASSCATDRVYQHSKRHNTIAMKNDKDVTERVTNRPGDLLGIAFHTLSQLTAAAGIASPYPQGCGVSNAGMNSPSRSWCPARRTRGAKPRRRRWTQ